MKELMLLALAGAVIAPVTATAQTSEELDLREWPIEWGGRTRDPYVGPDGKVWFVGQQGNYVAWFDPATGEKRRYEIEEGTYPHTVIVDDQGFAWYAGNRNGRIGKIHPETGELTIYMTGEAADPHTMVFDGKGHIWFTSQGSSRVGRLDMATGEVVLVDPHPEGPANPYGIVLDSEGNPWVSLFRTNYVARIDANTLEVTRFAEATPQSRSRRIEVTSDGLVWYVDEPRGMLGRIDPRTGEVREWQTPGGPGSRPYALTRDDQGSLWFSETGPVKQLVGFDPRTEEFFSVNEVTGNIRHMMFHAPTRTMWFGTDAGYIGRIVVGERGIVSR